LSRAGTVPSERAEGLSYLSFDHQGIKAEVERASQIFLLEHSDHRPLVLDEAQKVPEIFDAIKFEVDQNQTPGRFLLLGSTEFSRLSQIIRLYSMTLAETLGLDRGPPATRKDVLHYLKNGGMPGIFAVRDTEEQDGLLQDWIDLTCLRDIQQFKTLKLDGKLAFELLKLSATLEEPTRAQMARATRMDPRRAETHLLALCGLFVPQRLNPHPSGTGKPIGIRKRAGADTVEAADSGVLVSTVEGLELRNRLAAGLPAL
jgi:hypothetical protein